MGINQNSPGVSYSVQVLEAPPAAGGQGRRQGATRRAPTSSGTLVPRGPARATEPSTSRPDQHRLETDVFTVLGAEPVRPPVPATRQV
jgi:hypothetical protein